MEDKNIYENPREVISEALLELGEKNPDVVYVSCDSSLGASGGPFNEKYPERHFEFGIQEQSAMGHAAGMALNGKVPMITAYVPFITCRCFEQIRDDVCKTELNVNIMGNNCGFSVSALGPTHVVLEDVGILSSIPNITIVSPADGPEYRKALQKIVELDGPVYFRVHRQEAKRINARDAEFVIGKGKVLRKGSDITIIAVSSTVSRSLDAAQILEAKDIDAEVINMHTIKPIDKELILKSSAKTKKVVTVEEHNIINGLGSAVSNILSTNNPVKLKKIGVNDVFAKVGEYEEVMEYYGLTSPKIAESIRNFINL
ncbi:MAG: transketolase C-terminal domain-containing protein [Candidatus Humimicrobiaceae bacterium]